MRENILNKTIKLKDDLEITLFPLSDYSRIFEIDDIEAGKFGEARIQILEAKRYEYELSNKSYQLAKSDICFPSKSNVSSRGLITPGNYVGTLELSVIKEGEKNTPFYLEVLATKFNLNNDYDESYRANYRSMLESITEKCTELLMQANSPVNQYFEPDFNENNKTIYQRFSFVSSILNSSEFEESIQKILSSPKTNWINKEEVVDVRSIKRFNNKNVKDLLKGNNRIPLPSDHPLKAKLESISVKINSYRQEISVDNHENRFIKHALRTYLQFCEDCKTIFKTDSKDEKEAIGLVNKLETYLNHSFFRNISRPTTLKLNSPSLQRKSGYRQVLKSWLMFDLASKLTWAGGEDVYKSGKRDIATLYEYWLFFILYDLFKEKFGLNYLEHEGKVYKHLFETTKDGLNLIIKAGQHTALSGSSFIRNRKLNIKFSFNRTFSGSKDSYPKSGSWTTSMRPDYTLSVWPQELTDIEAEKQELIVHIHFDAKYKVDNFKIKTKQNDIKVSEVEEQRNLNKTKKEERAGVYKNADLLKMHAYKDAIRRTGGAYILYPGNKETRFKGFHELIPGLGAFALNPANKDQDVKTLSSFIDEVIEHLADRASQRENIADKTYRIYDGKEGVNHNLLNEQIPEYIGTDKLIPDETYVLIGYYKSPDHLEWILNNQYNFRTGINKGSFPITENEVRAKYILLHGPGETITSRLFELGNSGVEINSKQNLIDKDYPTTPNGDLYLMYGIKEDVSSKFNNVQFDIKELKKYSGFRNSPKPITVTLSELMPCIVK